MKVKDVSQKEVVYTKKQAALITLPGILPQIKYPDTVLVVPVDSPKYYQFTRKSIQPAGLHPKNITTQLKKKAGQAIVKETNNSTQHSDFWDDLWEDLRDFLLQLAFLAVGIFFIGWLTWLVANGMTWLAILVVAVLIVVIIIIISNAYDDIIESFKNFFKRRN